MQDWIHSINRRNQLFNPWIHLDLFVCPYGRDSKDMAWGTDSCRRLYWDMNPTLFFETLSSLGPDKVVTFDWPGTSEATDCFPAVYEQDPLICMNWQAVTAALSQDSWCCSMQWENDRPVNSWNRIQISKSGWLTSWFPTPLATTTQSSCLSLEMGSWEAWAPRTITHVVRLLAVLACICSVKGISWSRRAVVCAVISVANLYIHRESPHWHEYSWPSTWISPDGTDSLLFSEAA